METIGTLLFLLTLAGTLGSLIYSIFTFLTHHKRRAYACIIGLVVWFGIYMVLMIIISFITPPTVLAHGQEHCFDDMCFSVQNVKVVKKVENGTVTRTAQGTYYLVAVQLRNAAQQAPQKPDNPSLYLTDRTGHTYSLSSSAQAVIGQEPQWNQRLQAGEIQVRTAVFDVPIGIQQPYLVITEGGWPSSLIIGDENSLFHAKTLFSLTS